MRAEILTCQQAFGDVLRRVRLYRHLTPEDLAVHSGVPFSRILRFENGMIEPTLSEVFLLSRALGTRLASFVEGVEMIVNGALHGPRRNGEDRVAASASLRQSTPAQTRSEDAGQ